MREAALRLRYAPPVLFAGIALLLSALLDVGLLFGGSVVASFTLFWVVNYPRLHRQTMDANAKKVLDEGRNAGFLCEHRMSIDEGGLSAASELAQARVSWAMVERVEQTTDHIFIYVGSMVAYVIPKWAFDSVQKAEDFFHAAQAFQKRQ